MKKRPKVAMITAVRPAGDISTGVIILIRLKMMKRENYELYIEKPSKYNRLTGCFIKGHVPFNKGVPMDKWMDGRKKRRVLKCLELGRKMGNPSMAGWNRKMVVGIKDGKLFPFRSAVDAERKLRAKGIKIHQRNIRSVCQGKPVINNSVEYVRKKAGGFRWFYADDVEKYKSFLNNVC